MAARSELSAAEKVEVVLKFLRREDTAARLAQQYGISEETLAAYVDAFVTAGRAGVDEERRIRELEREVVAREQVIGELRIANRILERRGEAGRGDRR